MTRRSWIVIIGAGLCASLLPACSPSMGCRKLFGWGQPRGATTQLNEDCRPPVEQHNGQSPEPPVWQATNHGPLISAGRLAYNGSPYPGVPGLPQGYRRPDLARVGHGENDPAEPQHEPPLPIPMPEVKPAVIHRPQPAPPQEKKEPLVEAMDRFLKGRSAEALALLEESYDDPRRDLYQRLLPVMADLTRKNLDQLDSQEVANLYEQLQGVMTSLRPRSRLTIDKMCFCSKIEGYANYEALPRDHTFKAASDTYPGDWVKLYVELRNFAIEACPPHGYRTVLHSKVEIKDAKGEPCWSYDFREQEEKKPLIRKALWHDQNSNYGFHLPRLPPGDYTLTITVQDQTRRGAWHEAQKSLAFRVGS